MAEERSDLEKPMSNQGKDETDQTEHLKENIAETRSQMGETIDAIQDRLSFTNISEQVSEHVNHALETAKTAAYDATIGKAAGIMKNISNDISGSSIVRTAKNNPLPFMLIGVGAGLLAYQGFVGKRGNGHSNRRKLELAGNASTGEAGKSHIDMASDKLAAVKDTVTDAAGTAYDKVSGAVGSVYSKAGDLGTAVQDQYETHIESHPLAVGAVALAFGAAVGMAIPSTQYEGEWMGDARDNLMNKAQDKVAEMIDTTKESISGAVENFGEEAKLAITE